MSLEKLETQLAAWRAMAPQLVAIGRLREAEAYQPRDKRIAPFRDQGRLEDEAERHVADLTAKLGDGRDLDPLLVANIDGTLFVIDGHHRMKAYRNAGRRSVPACVRETTEAEALLASKAVNCDGVKLPMHPEQSREAAWQYLAAQTLRGRLGLPEGDTLRTIGRTFGIGKDTVAAMLKRLPTVNAAEYSPESTDPGTGWPRWKYVKGNAWRDAFANVPDEARDRHRDERRAAKLAKMIDRDGLEAFLRSLRLLAMEALDEAADRLAEAGDVGADY